MARTPSIATDLDRMYEKTQELQLAVDNQQRALNELAYNLDKLLQLQESMLKQLKGASDV